jgi:putative flippase GtrA
MSDLLRRVAAVLINRSRLSNNINFNLRTNRFLRYLVAGGINTLFGFAVYSIAIVAGAAVWFALLAGTISGTVFNFFTTGGYVFRELSLTRFPRFLICYLLVYAINLVLIELLSTWLNNKLTSQAILIFPMALFSYVLMARFVFTSNRTTS